MYSLCRAYLLLFALVATASRGAWAAEPQAPAAMPPQGSDTAGALELEDPVEAFVPLRPRGPREQDRVDALALFAAARVAEQKQDFPQALRAYERAWRMDPGASLALREIVPLAFNLDRQAEAIRYALIMAEREPTDPVMLRRLALYLTEEVEMERALRLYEKSLALDTSDKPSKVILPLRLEMGRLYFVTKKYAAAANQFALVSQALANPEKSGLDAATQKALLGKPELTYQLFGEAFLEADRPEEALAAFEKLQEAKHDDGLYAYNRAKVDLKQKQPAQALAKLQTFFDKHLSNQGTVPYQLLVDALTQLGQERQLLKRLEKLQAADPDNTPLAYFLAQRYRQAGDLERAEPIYRKILERHASRPPLEAYQSLVDIYRRQKNTEKLLSILGDSVGRLGSLSPLGDSGKALLEEKAVAASVVAAATTQVAADPAKLTYGQRLAAALVAVEIEDFASAAVLFDLALQAEGGKPAETLMTWGLELFAAGQYGEAIKIFQRGLADGAPGAKDPRLHFYLAGALEMEGRTDEAIAEARTSAAQQSDSSRFESRVPWIQYHAKRYADARQSYLAIIEKYDKIHDNPDLRDVLHDARLAMSNLCVVENKMDEAEAWIEQVLDEFPEDAGALNDLAYLWTDSGKHLERALEMIQQAVTNEPQNMAYRDSLGWSLFRLGRYPEAVAELQAAASGDEPDGVILDHLAEALHKAGDTAGAMERWQQAAEFFDKHSEPAKAAQVREKMSQAPKAATAK